MRSIAEATGAKIRIRGRGSGHLEIDGQREAPTPLMVAVTTDKCDENSFRAAIEMTLKELRSVEKRFEEHCRRHGIQHQGCRFSVGNIPENAVAILADVLEGVPFTPSSKGGQR